MAIWYTRNKLLHKRTNQRVEDLVVFVRSYCAEIEALTEGVYRSPPSLVVRCFLQLTSLVKINVDANFFLAQRKAYSGVSIKDEHGQIMGDCSRLTYQVPTIFTAEALVVVHGLRFALELGFLPIILEGDSRSVIQKLTGNSDDFS